MNGNENIESVLTRAFAPVEPPPHLYEAFESKLEQVSFNAAEELSDWELVAMRDPRNWVKPAVAVVAGTAAAGTLVVLGMRHRRRDDDKGAAAVKALSSALGDVRREVERSARRTFQ
ncbi:MAG: hypothetical protein ACRDKI_10295 [Solirubrobacterales bacterium]